MQTNLAPPNKALPGTIGVAMLLLGAWCAPAIASSGVDVHCSEAVDEMQVADIAVPSLTIEIADHEIADHGTTGLAAADSEIIDQPIQSLIAAPAPRLSPSKEAILHGIFSDDDKTAPAESAKKSVHVLSPASLAGATKSRSDDDAKSHSRGDHEETLRNEMPANAAGLAGDSTSDAPRFRHQMYRTDI